MNAAKVVENIERRASIALLQMYNSQLTGGRMPESQRRRVERNRQIVIAILRRRGDLPAVTR